MKKLPSADHDHVDTSRRNLLRQSSLMATGLAVGPFVWRIAQAQSATFDFYISPAGSNSNPGTQAQPWALSALSDPAKTQIRGKRIGLLSGRYVITNTVDVANQMMVPVVHGGSGESARTVIESVEPRGAVLTNNNNGTWVTYPNVPTVFGTKLGADYVTFRNIRFESLCHAAITVQSNYIRIEGCDIYDIDLTRVVGYPSGGDNVGAVYTANGAHDLVISNCRIEKVNNAVRKSTGVNYNACCLGPFFHYSNITVEYCSFYDASIGVHFKDDYSGVTVRNCYFHSTCNVGIWGFNARSAARPAARNYVYHNVFNRQAVMMANSYGDMQADVDVYNNTMIAGPASAANGVLVMFEPGGHANPGNAWQLNFYNNVIADPYNSGAYTMIFKSGYAATTAIARMDYNVYPPRFSVRDDNSNGGTYSTIAAWRSHISGKDVSSLVSADVKFTNLTGAVASDFRLLASSVGSLLGRLGGLLTGAPVDVGAYASGATVGHNFTSTVGKIPVAPSPLNVI